MAQLESIILYCLKQLNKERTVYSIYHLLNGKKSSQTIQDAHLFNLKKFFGIMDVLTRETFNQRIETLLNQKLIYKVKDQTFFPTPSGDLFLKNNPLLRELNGWEFHQLSTLFWERLSLLIQVASNFEYHETNYVPIQKNKDVHIWLKSTLKDMKVSKNKMASQIYAELLDCFSENKGLDPSVLVYRLTGYQQIGLTGTQLAQKLSMSYYDYYLQFVHIIHFMMETLRVNPDRFPVLSFLYNGLIKSNELTQSSKKTWQLLTKGYSLEHIAQIRQLKLSTIEDHLVEIALNIDRFSIHEYVDPNLQDEILRSSKSAGSRQLKLIKAMVTRASYFQIRLVLAKFGDKAWS
ncbi:helix-turn-helix domain-containing protein [Neobacillus mesonae]|uniref:helix-turn-helix domain-containing protein n=1 Tax=Neobacillus mesonae TaxID=1193713 RepID=UPI00203D21C6|nr:helix-turn-helix domain-containing protein [Neobacillus mesonae]MCM3566755.1 helix-turn-helix domain-containing protein [Neobacillus mesonae]